MSEPLLEEMPLRQARRSRAVRGVTISVMLVALVISALTRDWAHAVRENASRGSSPINTNGQTRISSMNSFTLALLLGGLRGPLVMMLWTSSEAQKQDKNLEDFDTTVELIRLLQPEFDTVHIFQVWNKAYNISVQMSSLFNKYTTILDAIDYGQNVLRTNPDNINMLEAVGDVYFNKLGNASEKTYYRAQVRKESLPHAMHQKLAKNDPGWRRLELDPLLDDNFNLLAELVRPLRQRPADLPADQPFNDGSPMQYLKPFEPFKYGVSPVAIGYNYYMQAQTLQRTTHAKHAQLSDQVVDSRPAIALKFWSEEEQEVGRRNEQLAFGVAVPSTVDRIELELPVAQLPLDKKPVNAAKFAEAIYNYDRSAQVTASARAEYKRHLAVYTGNLFTYDSHIDGLQALEHYAKADAAYLRAMSAAGDERTKWVAVAKDEYGQAILWYQRILMKYYTDDAMLAQALPGLTKDKIEALPADVLEKATIQIQLAINRGAQDSHAEDRNEYVTYFQRSAARLQIMDNVH